MHLFTTQSFPLVTFTEEILNGKLHFSCRDKWGIWKHYSWVNLHLLHRRGVAGGKLAGRGRRDLPCRFLEIKKVPRFCKKLSLIDSLQSFPFKSCKWNVYRTTFIPRNISYPEKFLVTFLLEWKDLMFWLVYCDAFMDSTVPICFHPAFIVSLF